MNIHHKIKLVRLLSGYRQSDLAEILNVKQSVVARYESEGGRVPRADAIEKIANATGWPIEWFEDNRLGGLLVSRLALPQITYSETALSTIERGLSILLPELFALPIFQGAKVCRIDETIDQEWASVMETEQVYVVYTDNICLVMFPSQNLNSLFRRLISSQFDDIAIKNSSLLTLQAIWASPKPYGTEFVKMLQFAEIPEHFIAAAEERKLQSTITAIKVVMEITPPSGMQIDLLKEIQLALEKIHIKVNSIRTL